MFVISDGRLHIIGPHRGYFHVAHLNLLWLLWKHKRKLSQHEKYCKALLLTSELASVASGASHIHFHRRMKLLKELIDHWKSGEEVGLVDLDLGVCK